MKPLWVVQQNLTRPDYLEKLKRAFHNLDVPHQLIDVIPFSDELPPIETDLPIIAYGTTTLIKNIARTGCYRPGIFFHPENFQFSAWEKGYGKENLLNADGYITTCKELVKSPPEYDFFMRPNNDLKDFSGSVVNAAGLKKFYDEVSAGGFLFDTDIEVLVAPVKATQKEWRAFIVDGKVVAGSQYRLKSMLRPVEGLPPEVCKFANEMAAKWAPEPMFVMDVAEWQDKLYIVELNCFNASGFYESIVSNIVAATIGKNYESS